MCSLLPGPTGDIPFVGLPACVRAACAMHPHVYSAVRQSRRKAGHLRSASAATAVAVVALYALPYAAAYMSRVAVPSVRDLPYRLQASSLPPRPAPRLESVWRDDTYQ